MVDIKDAFKLNSTDTVAKVFGTPASLFNTLIPVIFTVAGVILFFLLLFGGFSIIMAHGEPKELEKGSKVLTGALIGFLLIIASYWIMQIIQIVTGVPILNSTL